MSEQLEQKSFDPNKRCKTENGYDVHLIVQLDKILGFIVTESGEALMSEWDLNGKRKTVYPRKTGEKHNLDLVNIDG